MTDPRLGQYYYGKLFLAVTTSEKKTGCNVVDPRPFVPRSCYARYLNRSC